MKLYDTQSKTLKSLPIGKSPFNVFVCGPTVYDTPQLGNIKTYIQFDMMVRFMRYIGIDVFYLQNVTDIDDKIIERAKQSNQPINDFTAKFEKEYFDIMQTVNVTSVSKYARASDHIEQIISQVQTLLNSGHAYAIESDGIYFEISTFKDYGKLSGRTELNEEDAKTRIDASRNKRGWNDFCLWKFSKPGDPVWNAPFGDGRPGWHIEDTAITEHFFGPQYDLHGGGVDLIFPHHEAELTQMEAASGKVPFVAHWVHTGFLTVSNTRMGKSNDNFITLKDVLDKNYDPMALRLAFMQPHYRSRVDFSWESLDMASNRLSSLQALSDLRYQGLPALNSIATGLHDILDEVCLALGNDLNTAIAFAKLSQLDSLLANGLPEQDVPAFSKFLENIDAIFGLKLGERQDISNQQLELLSKRADARSKGEWGVSDQLRTELLQQGLQVRDVNSGQIWSRA